MSDEEPEIIPPSKALDNIDEAARRGIGRMWKKGQSGNPGGMNKVYYRTREIALQAAPEMIQGLINKANTSLDDRVASFCMVAVLDRAGVRPVEYNPKADANARPPFDVSKLSPEERNALRKMIEKATTASADEPEVLPPDDDETGHG